VERGFQALGDDERDLLVIGGGIHGVWAARWAALQGLDVALVEAEDFAAGTSSRSTMLAHGGLRYLAQYEVGLVREALTERGELTRQAPHLVQPLTFLVPFYEEAPLPAWQVKLGIRLYSLLARGSGYPSHEFLTKRQVLSLEPGLREEGLRGGALYWDAQILSPERLTTSVARQADEHGAEVVNHARAVDVTGTGRVDGAVVEDQFTGQTRHVEADAVVNATGPYLDAFLEDVGLGDDMLRLTKGIHLATPQFTHHAVVVNARDDRTFFAVPWHDHEWVGTTDTDYAADPGDVRASADDVEYLQDSVREYFPEAPVDEVRFTNAGLRNLLNVEGVHPSDVSREAKIHAHEGSARGLVSLVGGKFTTARATARELVDQALDHVAAEPGPAREPARLPGGHVDPRRAYREASQLVSDRRAEQVVQLYGSEWPNVLGAGDTTVGGSRVLEGQVDRAIAFEGARTVSDVMRRRTLAWAHPNRGRPAADEVAKRLVEWGIHEDVEAAGADAYRELLDHHEAWRG